MIFELKNDVFKERLNFLVNILYYALIFAIIFFTVKYIIPFIAPFLIGFLIAFFLRPISKKISKITRINNKFCNIFLILFCYFLIATIIWIVIVKISYEIKSLASSTQQIYSMYISPFYEFLNEHITIFLNTVFKDIDENTKNFMENIPVLFSNLFNTSTKYLLGTITKIGAKIPDYLISITFSIISSIYFSYDYFKITNFVINLFPEKTKHFLFKTKYLTIKTIVKYFKAYCFLMFYSFILLTIGFFIIKIENPIGIAAIICIFDSIPIIGSGIILIPWAIILFAENNFSLAIAILVVFLVTNILRSFIEPKVLGKNLGIHPLLALFSIYIGAKVLGFIGIIVAPITTNILFLLYKTKPKNQIEKFDIDPKNNI